MKNDFLECMLSTLIIESIKDDATDSGIKIHLAKKLTILQPVGNFIKVSRPLNHG